MMMDSTEMNTDHQETAVISREGSLKPENERKRKQSRSPRSATTEPMIEGTTTDNENFDDMREGSVDPPAKKKRRGSRSPSSSVEPMDTSTESEMTSMETASDSEWMPTGLKEMREAPMHQKEIDCFNSTLERIVSPAIIEVDRINKVNSFSLLSKLHVPLDTSFVELMHKVDKRHAGVEIFDENCPPAALPESPSVPENPPGDSYALPYPLLEVTRENPLFAEQDLYEMVEDENICLIEGLTEYIGFDLSLFDSERMVAAAPDQQIEVRRQYLEKIGEHFGPHGYQNETWKMTSVGSGTSLRKYVDYQKAHKQMTEKAQKKLKVKGVKYADIPFEKVHRERFWVGLNKYRREGEPQKPTIRVLPKPTIEFGTNFDLSDEERWAPQLKEIEKLPPCMRVKDSRNMLSHLGNTILGMNSVQMYFKVPGVMTPLHQENNCIASVNINIGPGDCLWMAIPNAYLKKFYTECEKREIDFRTESFYPLIPELELLKIPYYYFTQKPGDVVYVGFGCLHWVRAVDHCNNIAWNVAPMVAEQLNLAIHSYEWNKELGFQSLVPLQHLAWNLAKTKIHDQEVYKIIRGVLVRSATNMTVALDWAKSQGKTIEAQPRLEGEQAHYCYMCQEEVFNILFIVGDRVRCLDCISHLKKTSYRVVYQMDLSKLRDIFDGMERMLRH